MEAVKKAASGAVESIRNSPLFKRKFGTRSTPNQSPAGTRRQPGAITPEKDTTPFVQGVYFHVDYLGKKSVDSYQAQDHGCTDEAVALLWSSSQESPLAKQVSIKITTTSIRIKEASKSKHEGEQLAENGGVAESGRGSILYEFPLFSVSYCGTNPVVEEAFSFVAKEDASGKFYCYVFRCANKDKSYALALAVAKAFYLAYQILLEQQGNFPPGPERELLFEPQRPDDTQHHPDRPVIDENSSVPQEKILDVTDSGSSPSSVAPPTSVPFLRLSRPSQTSDDLALASADADFARLAKARSNPDILRSNLDTDDITGGHHTWTETLRLHADAGSNVPTPIGSIEQLNELNDSNSSH